MNTTARRDHRLIACLLSFLLVIASCSSSDDAESTPDVGQDPVSDDTQAVGGRILLSASAITGQQGRLLVVLGPGNSSGFCVQIDSDPWTLDETALRERDADADPCTTERGDARFEAGSHAVTAAVIEPGSQTPSATTAAIVETDGSDTTHALDGAALSSDASASDRQDGRILVTVSEITGRQGQVLVVLAQARTASFCAIIDADPWSLPTPRALTEVPESGGPCDDELAEVTFRGGDRVVTAGVLTPGSTEADAMVEAIVSVDGDVTLAIDGAELSA